MQTEIPYFVEDKIIVNLAEVNKLKYSSLDNNFKVLESLGLIKISDIE